MNCHALMCICLCGLDLHWAWSLHRGPEWYDTPKFLSEVRRPRLTLLYERGFQEVKSTSPVLPMLEWGIYGAKLSKLDC
jgi:hypothetical protein